jgi:hypothetical protein
MNEIDDKLAPLPAEPPPGFKSEFDWRVCELLAREYERVALKTAHFTTTVPF